MRKYFQKLRNISLNNKEESRGIKISELNNDVTTFPEQLGNNNDIERQ